MSGSSDSVNYSVRPNKSVERKLIVEAISRLPPELRLEDYRYIGMGAMWFVDFVLFHRFFRIQDMISVEKENHARAYFNRPYSCIKVIEGETTALLDDGQLPLKDKRSVAWFDYDGLLSASVLKDIQYVCWNAPVGSILLVTVNANKNFYRKSDGIDKLSVEESMVTDFGKLVPSPFPDDGDTRLGFPKLLGKMLRDHAIRTVLAGRKLIEFLPLFDFAYEDGSPMVTVGGILCDPRLRAACIGSSAFVLAYVGKAAQYRVEVPPLTFREKHAIDQLLPALQPPLAENLQKALQFSLTATQIENYCRFYPYYPLFWELFA
jgi:hypothetical protein